MTTDTIFGANEGDNQQGATPAKTEESGLLNALVGEKQKYKNIEELAKAYTNADAFIEQLKEENRKLREAAAAAKTVDDVLERLNKKESTPVDQQVNPVTLSRDDVAALVEQTLTGRETAKTRENNLLQADKLMKEKFGEKAAEVFKSKAATPDLQKVYMDLAATDPSSFVALFSTVAPPTGGVTTSTVNTATIPSGGNRESVPGTKEWAAKVRREKPAEYWSTEFQMRLQKMTIENPTLYFGG